MDEDNPQCRSKGRSEDDIMILKDWHMKQPHLPKNIDELMLHNLYMAFINGTNTMESAKKKLDSFFTARTLYPNNFEFPYRDPLDSEFKEACKFTKMFFLPDATPEDYRILMTSGFNPDKFKNHLNNMRLMMMLEVAVIKWPDINGMMLVMDSAGSDLSIVPKTDLLANISASRYLMSGLPVRVKWIVSFNSTSGSDFLVNKIAKPCISSKLRKRMVVTKKNEKFLEKYFPLEMLPCDYGGKALSSEQLNDEALKRLEEKRDWFYKLSKLCSVECKRPSDRMATYGTGGTFRYLDLD